MLCIPMLILTLQTQNTRKDNKQVPNEGGLMMHLHLPDC